MTAPATIDGFRVHASLTEERVTEAVERQATSLDDPGFCLACGADAAGVEPDAHECPCESCGENAVIGASDLMMEFV